MEIKYLSAKIRPTVTDALRSASITRIGDRFCLDACHMEDRKDYGQFKQIVEALRGRWTGQTHEFLYDPASTLEQVLNEGKIPNSNPHALFATPDNLVIDLMDLVDLPNSDGTGLRILEPHGGTGGIALAIRKRLPNAQIDVVEIDPFNREILQALGFDIIGHDWLTTEAEGYDYILANPPFQGNVYLEHCLKIESALRPGGRAGIIVPDALTRNSTRKAQELRNLIAITGSWDRYDDQPFHDQGTDVSVLVCRFERMTSQEVLRVWSGEDACGFPSLPTLNTSIALDCDSEFDRFCWGTIYPKMLEAQSDRADQVVRPIMEREIASAVGRLVSKEYFCLPFNDRIKRELADHYLAQVEGECWCHLPDTREPEPSQLSLFAA